jgi:four helix bundle protein
MDVQDLEIYRSAMILGERVWNMTVGWNQYERNTIGIQIARAADSIAANLSEGYGRYHFRENRQFCYYARGSLLEVRTWLQKAESRGLLSQPEFNELNEEVNILGKRLNAYIKSIGNKSKTNSRADD